MGRGPDRKRRRARPALEKLEGRDLPIAPTLLAGPVAPINFASIAANAGKSPGVTAEAVDAPRPTARELARQAFVARFSGSFATGRPRFTDQASQIYLKGGGTSSAFLHGDIQMLVYPPAQPGGRVTGVAALIVKNVTNSGNLLILDLDGDTSTLDKAGRPTRLTWTVDGSSGGTFSGATGQGTARIVYRPKGKPRAPSGGVGVVFKGRIEINGVTNLLREG